MPPKQNEKISQAFGELVTLVLQLETTPSGENLRNLLEKAMPFLKEYGPHSLSKALPLEAMMRIISAAEKFSVRLILLQYCFYIYSYSSVLFNKMALEVFVDEKRINALVKLKSFTKPVIPIHKLSTATQLYWRWKLPDQPIFESAEVKQQFMPALYELANYKFNYRRENDQLPPELLARLASDHRIMPFLSTKDILWTMQYAKDFFDKKPKFFEKFRNNFFRFSEYDRRQAVCELFRENIPLDQKLLANLDMSFSVDAGIPTAKITSKSISPFVATGQQKIPEQLSNRKLYQNRLRNSALDASLLPIEKPGKHKKKDKINKSALNSLNITGPDSPYSILKTPQGNYYLTDITLGIGGSGKVKLAQNIATGEWVAIKIIKYPTKTLDAVDSRNNAINMAYNLRTLGILKDEVILSERGKDKSLTKHYFIIPFYHGILLRYFLEITVKESKGKKIFFTFDKKLEYAIAFANAVKTYHDQGYIIKDIKPENAIFEYLEDGTLVIHLIDLDHMQKKNLEKGKLNYTLQPKTTEFSAPELKNATQTQESDIFALGVVFEEIFDKAPEATAIKALSERMKATNPEHRPKIDEVITTLNQIPRPMQIPQDFSQISNVKELTKLYQSLLKIAAIKQPGGIHWGGSEEKLTQLKEQFLRLVEKRVRTLQQTTQTAMQAIQAEAVEGDYLKILEIMLGHRKNPLFDGAVGIFTDRRMTKTLSLWMAATSASSTAQAQKPSNTATISPEENYAQITMMHGCF